MSRISLDGQWQLTYITDPSLIINHPFDLKGKHLPTIPAVVPGNVELDLVRAGMLPEPFFGKNIRQLRPYEFYDYWYERDFIPPPDVTHDRWDLVLNGVDTIAQVWVNGTHVGKSSNMLVEHIYDVTDYLVPNETNHIAVQIRSSMNYAVQQTYDAGNMSWEHREEGGYLRKAPHGWGWDIMPRCVSAGIWRSVWLEPHPENAFEQLYFWTESINPDSAVLGVRFQFRTKTSISNGLKVQFKGVCGDHEFTYTHPVEFVAGGCHIPVPGAKLWQPSGHGEPNLYTITTSLFDRDTLLTKRTERFGIRKLVVKRTIQPSKTYNHPEITNQIKRMDIPSDPSSQFIITVNDQPLMVKGTNWVPLDAFHSRDAERLPKVIEMVKELGCNMIRCWGGNVYEDHTFFDLCDESGILVWQDFAFACNIYPQTEAFLKEVGEEAQKVIMKLRNHPSLAVWCGDNEIDMAYATSGRSPETNRISREVIPQMIQRFDPFREYIPSSPYVSPQTILDSNWFNHTAEQHLWGPRGYYKSSFYTRHNAHFIGEIGYHGCPNRESIEKFISPEKLFPWQNNDEWIQHSIDHWIVKPMERDRIKLMANQVKEVFGMIPDNLDDFILASQITQAEAVKFFIESARLRKWYTSGILWWNIIDGYPQFSDAVVDYYFGKKIAYRHIQRSQQPVCIIVGEANTGKYLPVIACNDTLTDCSIQYRIKDAENSKEILAGEFLIPANQNWQIGCIRTFASDQRLYLLEWEIDGKNFRNHYISGTPPFSLQTFKEWLTLI